MENNPLIEKEKINKFDSIPFDKIKTKHFLPAIEHALKVAKENIESMKNDTSAPSFENTILKLETGSELLDEVSSIYFNLMSAESDDEFKSLAQTISPMLSEFSSSILMDEKIFEKIKAVYDKKNNLNLFNHSFSFGVNILC